jgi:hypothetical protein
MPVSTITVILDKDYKIDEQLASIATSLSMVKGVAEVKYEQDDFELEVARIGIRRDICFSVNELLIGKDKDFLGDVMAAYKKLTTKRGY